MVQGFETGDRVLQSRSMFAGKMPNHGSHPGFIVRHPDPDTVTQVFGQEAGIIGKGVGSIPVGPTAFILERLREVPVEQADVGFNLLLE